MNMTENELAAEIKSRSVGGFYFFYGDEDYLKNHRAAEMKKCVTGDYPEFASFNAIDLNFGDGEMNVIDVGGQDTKVIMVKDGRVQEVYKNEKCAAGTGKFVEVTAGRLGIPLDDLDRIASERTQEIEISSLCTVFAESEVVALVGRGVAKEDIAWGILNSVAKKVGNEYARLHDRGRQVYLTGGLCESELFAQLLSRHIGCDVISSPEARYAGALGAALMIK
jgi:predicted CoA-substrate-specific enzyme activase